jgi:hypothetical protein
MAPLYAPIGEIWYGSIGLVLLILIIFGVGYLIGRLDEKDCRELDRRLNLEGDGGLDR